MHGTELALQNRPTLLAVGFVEAARFWRGQFFVPTKTKLTRSDDNSCLALIVFRHIYGKE
jgi:hypothetical protein